MDRSRLCLWLLVALVLQILPATAETWRIAALERPPYASPDMPGGGIAVSALRKILAAADINLQVEFMPWTRAQALASTGAYAGYFPAWPEEVHLGFKGSLPLELSQVGIVQRTDTTVSWTDVHNLFANHKVGFVNTYDYPADVQQEINKVLERKPGCDDERDLTRKLSVGRVDLAVTDPKVMLHFAKELGIGNLEANPTVIAEKYLVLAMPNRPPFNTRRELLNSLIKQAAENDLCELEIALVQADQAPYCPSK